MILFPSLYKANSIVHGEHSLTREVSSSYKQKVVKLGQVGDGREWEWAVCKALI